MPDFKNFMTSIQHQIDVDVLNPDVNISSAVSFVRYFAVHLAAMLPQENVATVSCQGLPFQELEAKRVALEDNLNAIIFEMAEFSAFYDLFTKECPQPDVSQGGGID